MTVGDYCARWLAGHMGRLAPNAQRAYRSALTHHVLPAFRTIPLDALSPAIVRQWLREQLAAGRSVNAVKAAQTALSTVLTDALIDGHVQTNAAHGAGRRLWAGRAAPAPKALTPDETDALLAAARLIGSRWACDCFTVASRTGLRLGELLGLASRHVLLEGGAIRVERTYHGGGRFGPTKNKRARLVECSPQTVEILARLVDQAPPPGRALFPGAVPDRPLHPATVEWAFEQAASVAQLPDHYTIHCLRHTYASLLLAHGAPAQWVQQQLGHANYAITVDLYGSWLRTRRPDLTAILDQARMRHGIHPVTRTVPMEGGKIIPFRRP